MTIEEIYVSTEIETVFLRSAGVPRPSVSTQDTSPYSALDQ